MDELVEFRTEDGALVVVEGAGSTRSGARLVSRGDGPAQAARTFEGALDGVRAAAASALRVFRDGSLRPDAVEIEFGVRLSAEAGAVIAKGSAEGHLVVKLSWSPGQAPEPAAPAQNPPARAASGQQASPPTLPGQAAPDRTVPGPESADR
ncbi:CU044_2847 family protein [Streptomyces sp. NRRL WC-3744]|uniref:CU044_2847 family protein n=1 Tax=Streptomyces sp. NRRL WC-3744 TaxID=1463935 RepID=UPI0004C5DB34|nr:CU044_2847 family protein [Streptomyces sp. NRRL WC-3744]